MHPQLTAIRAQQHIADLHRAADHDRLVQAATTVASGHAATASHGDAAEATPRPTATPVSFLRRLRHRAAR
jgi:hypothetical protein